MSTSVGRVTPELQHELIELIDAASTSDHLGPRVPELRRLGRWDWAEDLADDQATAAQHLRDLRERLTPAINN